jgi:anti-anti-sigma factor
MSTLCRPDHVFREPLPEGLALYPFGRPSHHDDWLADEAVLAHVDRLDGPMVYLDMGTVEYITSTRIGSILRLAKRAHDRGGRMVLCNTGPLVQEIFLVCQLDKLPWLEVRGDRMPGGGLRLHDPAWLNWGGGIVASLARSFADARDFALMPVLGDALEEAGCTLNDVLDHCRGPGPHAQDCWVIRLLLETP